VKILHLSYKDDQEGAAIAVDRLCEALVRNKIDSKILVQKKVSDKAYTFSIANTNIDKIRAFLRIGFDLIINRMFVKNKNVYYTLPFIGTDISKHLLVNEADIIHIHWINRGFLSISSIEKLLKLNKPIVWTLHDSWSMTGGCHMMGECTQYENSCQNCGMLRIKSFAKYFQTKKQKVFNADNLHFIAPSTWTKNKALSSDVLKNKDITILPNCIDTNVFNKIDKIVARQVFSLPKNNKIVLFYISNDPRKGGKYIYNTIKYFQNKKDNDITFVGFGTSNLSHTIFKDLDIINVGRINDKYAMSILYNSADVLLAPALEEPFGQTYIEAMAMGTPCIAFNYSGPLDIIDHQKDGYLAALGNQSDLINGVEFCLENLEYLEDNAIAKVEEFFSYKAVSKIFNEYYKILITKEKL
jgi:glycosyltransferase involved in cell wall biosynthesis